MSQSHLGNAANRLGLARTKHYALTGRSVSGKEAADIGLINFA
jgi:enoyl-CoA hydratase/carnithine racemase